MALVITKKVDVVSQHVDTATTPETRFIEHSNEELSGKLAAIAAVQSVSVLTGANTLLAVVEVAVGAASTNMAIPAPFACKIVDAWAWKIGASADAGDLVALLNGATTLATFTCNVADNVKITPTLAVDHADNDYAEGDTITVDPTNSTDVSCRVFIVLKRTA